MKLGDDRGTNPSPGVTAPTTLTPRGTLEGYQDGTNATFISGWAWDRAKPDTPLRVAIYDGDTLLGSIVADTFRRDLCAAGKGNGRHGFVYLLGGHIRTRKAHLITARIADPGVVLPDVTTGTVPLPVTRRDRLVPPPIPHFSLPPPARWFYFALLRALLRPFPHPVYRLPAAVLGAIRMLTDAEGRQLDRELLTALGLHGSFAARVRTHWSRAYQRQADLILLAQGDRMTPRWAARQVRFRANLPPGGAILVSVHHNAGRLADLTLAARAYRLGSVTAAVRDPHALAHLEATAQLDATVRISLRFTEAADAISFGERQFLPQVAGRKGLRLLAEGGYLMMYADQLERREPYSPLLGKAVTIPRGAVWFAQRSGKPIIPYMVVPEGCHWRLWLGEPVAPTREGLCQALEECIRQAPASWERVIAMPWMEAPPWASCDQRIGHEADNRRPVERRQRDWYQ